MLLLLFELTPDTSFVLGMRRTIKMHSVIYQSRASEKEKAIEIMVQNKVFMIPTLEIFDAE